MRTTNDVQEYVQKFAPKKYSTIQNPETYFHSLLQELQNAELDLIEAMPPEPKSEDPLTIIGQHRANVNRAAEIAWQEIVLDRFPPEVDETGQPLEN